MRAQKIHVIRRVPLARPVLCANSLKNKALAKPVAHKQAALFGTKTLGFEPLNLMLSAVANWCLRGPQNSRHPSVDFLTQLLRKRPGRGGIDVVRKMLHIAGADDRCVAVRI